MLLRPQLSLQVHVRMHVLWSAWHERFHMCMCLLTTVDACTVFGLQKPAYI
jgi:hypothetical protein